MGPKHVCKSPLLKRWAVGGEGIPARLIAFSLRECRATLQKGAPLPPSLPPPVSASLLPLRLPPEGGDVDAA